MTTPSGHKPPCPYTIGALGAVSLLVTIGGACLAGYALDIRDLRSVGQTNRENIRALQSDITYIRESLDRIEASVSRRGASMPAPAAPKTAAVP